MTLRAETRAIVKELGLLVRRILTVFTPVVVCQLTTIAHLELRLLLTLSHISFLLVWYMQLILGQLWLSSDNRRYRLIVVYKLCLILLVRILKSWLSTLNLATDDTTNAVFKVGGTDWNFGIHGFCFDQRMDWVACVRSLFLDGLPSDYRLCPHILSISTTWGGLACSSRCWLVVRHLTLPVFSLLDPIELFGIWTYLSAKFWVRVAIDRATHCLILLKDGCLMNFLKLM